MTKHKILKVGIVQQACTADVEANKQNLKRNIADVAAQGAELVVLQELHNSLYFCQVESTDNFDLAEPIPGPSTDFYGQIARQHGIVLVTSLFERRAAGLYHNTAVVFERDGSIAGKYRKMHIPDDPAYYENSTSHRATWVSTPSTHQLVALGCRFVGTNGTPRVRGSWPCKVPNCSFTLQP